MQVVFHFWMMETLGPHVLTPSDQPYRPHGKPPSMIGRRHLRCSSICFQDLGKSHSTPMADDKKADEEGLHPGKSRLERYPKRSGSARGARSWGRRPQFRLMDSVSLDLDGAWGVKPDL